MKQRRVGACAYSIDQQCLCHRVSSSGVGDHLLPHRRLCCPGVRFTFCRGLCFRLLHTVDRESAATGTFKKFVWTPLESDRGRSLIAAGVCGAGRQAVLQKTRRGGARRRASCHAGLRFCSIPRMVLSSPPGWPRVASLPSRARTEAECALSHAAFTVERETTGF